MPLFDTNITISEVSGLQSALDSRAVLPDAWQDLLLASGWSNYGTSVTTAQCRKFPSGLIEVKGVIKKSAALVTNEVIATLPSGYRPNETMFLATWASGGTSRITVDTTGIIRLASGNNSGAGISFLFGV